MKAWKSDHHHEDQHRRQCAPHPQRRLRHAEHVDHQSSHRWPSSKIGVFLQGRPDYFLIAKKEIRSIKGLKGKRIAIGSFGASADLALRTVITEEGLDFDRDLVRLQMGGNSARYVSLVTGTVDATVLSPPFNLQAEKAGFKDLLWLGERLELPLAGLGVRDETIQQNPKQILAIIRAVFRAIAFAKTNPEETMRMLVDWARVDQTVAAKSYNWVNAAGRKEESSPTPQSEWW